MSDTCMAVLPISVVDLKIPTVAANTIRVAAIAILVNVNIFRNYNKEFCRQAARKNRRNICYISRFSRRLAAKILVVIAEYVYVHEYNGTSIKLKP